MDGHISANQKAFQSGGAIEIKLAGDTPFGKAGQTVTLNLAPTDVTNADELPTFLAGYANAEFLADQVSTIIPVEKSIGKYRQFSKINTFRRVDVKGSLQSKIPEVDAISALSDYACVERFVGSFVPDTQADEASYNMRTAAMKRCARAIKLDREYDLWAALTTTGNWNANNRVTLGATAQWDTGSSKDPIASLHTRVQASLSPVNKIWMGEKLFHIFIRDASVIDYSKALLGNDGRMADAMNGDVLTLPGLPPIHVVKIKAESGTMGTTTIDYMLQDSVVLTRSIPGPINDDEEIATSYTYRIRGNSGVGFETREFRVEDRGSRGGTMIVAYEASYMAFNANDVGGLITDAASTF